MNTNNQSRIQDVNPEELQNTNGGGLLGGGGDGTTSVLHGGAVSFSNSSTDEDGNSQSTSLDAGTDSLLYNQNS